MSTSNEFILSQLEKEISKRPLSFDPDTLVFATTNDMLNNPMRRLPLGQSSRVTSHSENNEIQSTQVIHVKPKLMTNQFEINTESKKDLYITKFNDNTPNLRVNNVNTSVNKIKPKKRFSFKSCFKCP